MTEKEFKIGQLVIFEGKVRRLTGELFHLYTLVYAQYPIEKIFQHLPDDMTPFIHQGLKSTPELPTFNFNITLP